MVAGKEFFDLQSIAVIVVTHQFRGWKALEPMTKV